MSETEEIPELRFEAGLPGFPEAHRFALVTWGDDSPFSILTCLEGESPEFLVAPPVAFFPDYEVEIDDETADRIGLSAAEDALLLVIVNVADGPQQATANLRAPIVVNRHSLRAVQAVLDDDSLPVRQPLFAG
ncbi:MAG: Flagellar assembly factor FliW [Acidimicrobiales bacterium]|nr:Flagellar assembly factor FliW [Acidimicrobiales bacterium]